VVKSRVGVGGSKVGLLLAGCCLLLAAAGAQELKVLKSGGEFEIRLGKAVEQDLRLTRNQPVDFTVSGPTWVRVYARLVWHAGMDAGEEFELVLRRPNGVSCETLLTEISSSARGPEGEAYSKWRSFYVRAPKGKGSYRLSLGSAPADTVAVRLALEAPPEPREAEPHAVLPRLVLLRDSMATGYYAVNDGSETPLLLVGPMRLTVEARLNYPKGSVGKRTFALTVLENGAELTRGTFDVRRMKAYRWAGRSDVFPSAAKRLGLELPAGAHQLAVRFDAGKGASGALRFLVRSKSGP